MGHSLSKCSQIDWDSLTKAKYFLVLKVDSTEVLSRYLELLFFEGSENNFIQGSRG